MPSRLAARPCSHLGISGPSDEPWMSRPQTTVYPLADANRALQDLKADRIQGTGVLVI